MLYYASSEFTILAHVYSTTIKVNNKSAALLYMVIKRMKLLTFLSYLAS